MKQSQALQLSTSGQMSFFNTSPYHGILFTKPVRAVSVAMDWCQGQIRHEYGLAFGLNGPDLLRCLVNN